MTIEAGAPGGAAPGASPGQLPPSSFDAAMAQQNNKPMVLDAEPPGAGSSLKIPAPMSKIPQPPLGAAAPLPDAGDDNYDPNHPAEVQARAELARLSQQQPTEQGEKQEEPLKATLLNGPELEAHIQRWKEYDESAVLPEPFYDKLISVPWDRERGTMRDVPVAEMKEGYMRVLDYTRKTQAASALANQAKQTIQYQNAFLNDLGNGNMRERLEDLGFGPQLMAAAQQIYNERLEEEQRLYALEKKGASKEDIAFFRAKLESDRIQKIQKRASDREKKWYEARELERQQAQRQNEDGKQLENQLAQLRPLAFKRLGMPDDASHNNAFQKVFTDILETGGGNGRPLRDVVFMAAQGAKQMVEEHISNAQALADAEREKDRALRQPLSPQRLPGPPAGVGRVQSAGNRRLGLNDFDAEMARLNGVA